MRYLGTINGTPVYVDEKLPRLVARLVDDSKP